MTGNKKKKFSKIERLKQLQEEEEKRLKEEEEARVKSEKEELARLEIEQIEKEKWQQLEAKDLGRKNEELEELYLLEKCFSEAEKMKREHRLYSQWMHYIQCDGCPDPSVAQEINTFISLWKEEKNETFEDVIAKSKLVLYSSVEEEPESTKQGLEMKILNETVPTAQLLLLENAPERLRAFEDDEVDICQFSTLGGVYHLDILELPPQCKQMKGWMIMEILKDGLQKFVYPPATTEDLETENVFPPIEVMLEVHENVIFFENPMVARWDAEGKHWKTDGISNVVYKSEERIITLSLDTLGPVTLIQDAHINMPYQSWELRPLDENKVLLTVTTVFAEIQIQIKEGLCMLASVNMGDKKPLSILEGKWMTPIYFIITLQEAGLNIFPTEYSHFYVATTCKVPLVEMKAYRQMALLSSAFAFGWSKWNMQCGSEKVIFKVSECLTKEQECIQDPTWTLLMFSGNRAQRLKIEEDSEAFSEALKEETEFHSTLYHMIKDFASQEAMEKTKGPDSQFIDSVCHMLLCIRIFSYS
uniref:Dynein axonemal intermediate chain 7 n=1 Tax=Myotis myotis TaxID=51298 RepID=A0A7J7Z0S0_MYOMY|nr:hypothetical protein mMyoMyo1_002094 [Myotis myotis]